MMLTQMPGHDARAHAGRISASNAMRRCPALCTDGRTYGQTKNSTQTPYLIFRSVTRRCTDRFRFDGAGFASLAGGPR